MTHPTWPRPVGRAPLLAGLGAAVAMAAVYAAVLAAANGLDHVARQFAADAVLLVPLWVAFGVQVALMVRLRQVHRGAHGAPGAAAAGGASAGVSVVGMLACCAHHAVELLPVAGVTAAAGVLGAWQRPLMVAGLAASLVGIGWMARALHRATTTTSAAGSASASVVPDRTDAVCVH